MSNTFNKITVSIVSHNQRNIIQFLLKDLALLENIEKIIITINSPEHVYAIPNGIKQKIIFVHNKYKKGFGANHNSAIKLCSTKYFLVLNPDIRIYDLNLLELLNEFEDKNVALVAPKVLNSFGELDDSCRDFPSFYSLFKKIFFKPKSKNFELSSEVDWVAGMFMLFDVSKFKQLNGFDSNRFFMYYEDVDLCLRIKKSGYKVVLNPKENVVHDARRESRRNLKYMRWHLFSMFRYLTGL